MVASSSAATITQKDIFRSFLWWHAFSETSLNFERLQALGYCNSMIDILRELYPKKEDFSKALQRHLAMYNTQANWGSIINGITIALEEGASTQDAENQEQTAELVTGLKAGLMGPLAGIGDTLDFGTLRPIIMGICIPFVMGGSVVAAFIPLIYQVTYMFFCGRALMGLGYRKGKESIMDILHSGQMQRIIDGFGMFGLFMMGALSATYVKLATPLVIATDGGNSIVIQEMLDKIAPGLLPIAVVFAIYLYISKRGPHYLRILLAVVIGSLALSFLGVL
ncbi:PTS fructose transporter subunit IID [Olsenella sp. HMSC062G07]|nr:PTS fructose transporter subunit IID [Olsenella sp. HMSC062G07]